VSPYKEDVDSEESVDEREASDNWSWAWKRRVPIGKERIRNRRH